MLEGSLLFSKDYQANLPSSSFSICQQFLALSAIFSSFSHFQLSAYHRKKGEGSACPALPALFCPSCYGCPFFGFLSWPVLPWRSCPATWRHGQSAWTIGYIDFDFFFNEKVGT
jgi:hypothetical protein